MTSVIYQNLDFAKDLNTVVIGEKGLLATAKLPIKTEISAQSIELRGFHQANPTLLFAEFENKTSRNLVYRVDKIKEEAAKHVPATQDCRLVLVIKSKEEAFAAALAVCRNWHPYNKKQTVNTRTVFVQLSIQDGSQVDLTEIQTLADSIRKSQLLMDTPCSELNTTTYVAEVTAIVTELKKTHKNVELKVIQGDELKPFGGIAGVGKGATSPPALVILSYLPDGADKTLALVGKGIVFDTGGLSIKPTASMCGMKHDMGGSAAVLGAFVSSVKMGLKKKVYGLLCLAENAVGPNSMRNDDILYMYSGKSVEINNTDAEGRLVLGDGVAYASKHLSPHIIIDIATLTGAQMVNTGLKHAGLVTSKEAVEERAIKAANLTGDYAFPMLYCPELLMKMFDSKVADMKNSVSDRMNAQSSCAAHFVEAHLDKSYQGDWLHVDMAGPGTEKEQATGYGVALLYQIVKDF